MKNEMFLILSGADTVCFFRKSVDDDITWYSAEMDLALNLGVVLAYKFSEITEFMHLILMLQSRFTHSEICMHHLVIPSLSHLHS